jgi:hypothetical protein
MARGQQPNRGPVREHRRYILIDIDERVASVTSGQPRESFKRVFKDVGPSPDLRIGVSDSVVVTIRDCFANSRSRLNRSKSAILFASPSDEFENRVRSCAICAIRAQLRQLRVELRHFQGQGRRREC